MQKADPSDCAYVPGKHWEQVVADELLVVPEEHKVQTDKLA
jgi:hypothetical protein